MKSSLFKKHLSRLLTVFFTASFITTASGEGVKAAEGIPKDFSNLQYISTPIQAVQTLDAVYGTENGNNVAYTTVSGSSSSGVPAMFNVVDLDNKVPLKSFPLEGTSSAWTHVKTDDGSVYIGSANKLFKYSPQENKVVDLGVPTPGVSSLWALTTDGVNVYGGGFPTGTLFKYDPAANKFTDYGRVDDGTAPGDDGKPEDYIRSIAYYKGHVYAGTGSLNGRIWKINPETGEKVRIEIPGPTDRPEYKGKYNSMGFVYGVTVVRNYLFVFFNGPLISLVYDMDKQQWTDDVLPNVRGLVATSGEVDGKVYYSNKDGNLYSFNLESKAIEKVMPFDASLRNSALINLKNDSEFGDNTFVALNYGGNFTLIDFKTGKKGSTPTLVEAQANAIQSVEKDSQGKIYISGYMGSQGIQYNPETGESYSFPIGQVEGMVGLGDKMYFGVYPKAEIYEMDITTKGAKPVKIKNLENEQDRPFAMETGDNKLFVGTVPGYGQHGGALSIYDTINKTWQIHRNVVQDQSIVGLAYKDGKVYGSTSISGGLGIEPITSRAKIFVWDAVKGEKLQELDLNLPGLNNVPMIGGLTIGPDGLLWGAANGFIFAMDTNTMKVVKYKNIYPEVDNYGKWRPVYMKWSKDGFLYANLGSKLTIINPETLESKFIENTSIFTVGNDDNIYLSKGVRFYKINVTDKILVNKDDLKKQIYLTAEIYKNSVIGVEVGKYPVEAAAALEKELAEAEAVFNKAEALQQEVDSALEELKLAAATFQNSKLAAPGISKIQLMEMIEKAGSSKDKKLVLPQSDSLINNMELSMDIVGAAAEKGIIFYMNIEDTVTELPAAGISLSNLDMDKTILNISIKDLDTETQKSLSKIKFPKLKHVGNMKDIVIKVTNIQKNTIKDIVELRNNEKLTIKFKLSPEDIKGNILNGKKSLDGYVLETANSHWSLLGGVFEPQNNTLTFQSNKAGTFTSAYQVGGGNRK